VARQAHLKLSVAALLLAGAVGVALPEVSAQVSAVLVQAPVPVLSQGEGADLLS
jgi:hypothetical protein